MRLQAQLVRPPRAPGRLRRLVGNVARELLEVLVGASNEFGKHDLRSTAKGTDIVPVQSHFIAFLKKYINNV